MIELSSLKSWNVGNNVTIGSFDGGDEQIRILFLSRNQLRKIFYKVGNMVDLIRNQLKFYVDRHQQIFSGQKKKIVG